MNNPIFYLARKMWKFSENNRPRVVLYFFLLVIANAISLLEPLIVAKILNTVQERGISAANLHIFFILLSLFIIQTIVFWVFHGPARVLELMASEEKSIILLDESTSSVDAQNEIAIYENIFSTYQDKTIIASIHKLHLLRMFNTIYIFDKGTISASGNFNELLERSPLFAEMWNKYTQAHKEWKALKA